MKKVQYIVSLLVMTATLLISCQKTKEIASPDDIGTYAFNLLNNLEKTTEEAYLNKLYTYEELQRFVKNNQDQFEKEFKDNLSVLTKANYDARTKLDYKRLNEIATSLGIQWNAIEAINFRYWPRAKNGVKSIKGDLFFTHSKGTYKVLVTAFDAGNKFFITKIEGLEKVPAQK